MNGTPEERWMDLWKRAGLTGDAGAVFADLERRYAEPHRSYHVLAHVVHALDEFERLRPLAKDPEAIELAIWFHDAVYNPLARDNEKQSGELARSVGAGQKVVDLILATRHDSVPDDLDARILVDVDLAILGQPEAEYDGYEQGIGVEYSAVPEPLFKAGRAAVLRSLLERPRIYGTDLFLERYEAQARQNLGRSLQSL